VVPKLVRAVTQIKVAIMSYYAQYFAVIAHNTEQHRGFGSALPPEESHITTKGVIYPHFMNHWSKLVHFNVFTVVPRWQHLKNLHSSPAVYR